MAWAGEVLVFLGVLVGAFAAFQLWGTGVSQARDQDELLEAFERTLAAPEPAATPGPEAAARPERPATAAAPAAPAPEPTPTGEAVAVLSIPRLGVRQAVVEGVSVRDLQKGPGHFPKTPLPGEPGNAAIAGHRTTYGAPFSRLDELDPGDEIVVATRAGSFRYAVTTATVVEPTEVGVAGPTPDDRLTLTTCHPRFSAAQRLVVTAALQGPSTPPTPTPPPVPTSAPTPEPASPPPDPSTSLAPPPTSTPAEPPAAEAVAAPELADAGLGGDPAERAPAARWALALAVLALGARLLAARGPRWRRAAVAVVALPAVALVAFSFFEHLNRALPAGLFGT